MRPEHWLFTIPLRLRLLFRWARADQELDDELRDHLERKTQEYVAHRIDRFAFQPGNKSWSVQKSRRKGYRSQFIRETFQARVWACPQQHQSTRRRGSVVFRIAPDQVLLWPFHCPIARVTLPCLLRHQRSQHGEEERPFQSDLGRQAGIITYVIG